MITPMTQNKTYHAMRVCTALALTTSRRQECFNTKDSVWTGARLFFFIQFCTIFFDPVSLSLSLCLPNSQTHSWDTCRLREYLISWSPLRCFDRKRDHQNDLWCYICWSSWSSNAWTKRSTHFNTKRDERNEMNNHNNIWHEEIMNRDKKKKKRLLFHAHGIGLKGRIFWLDFPRNPLHCVLNSIRNSTKVVFGRDGSARRQKKGSDCFPGKFLGVVFFNS
jgi:hypothetical protein